MRISWIWALPLLAIQGLTACATSETGAGAAATAADPATLTAYHWQLREVRNPQGQLQTGWSLPPAPAASTNAPDRARAVQLTFDQGRVAVARLCNALSASYQLDGQALAIGPVIGTMMACPDSAAMALEQQVGQRLSQASRWAIAAPQAQPGRAATPVLTLSFQDGGQWLLDGEPTDATRYGSAGERIFLEVAPQRVACSHPLMPQYQCLQVRAIEYDGQGLKTRVGPWENFYSEIQGYTHQPGVRNVLRIQRFQRPVTPADASSYAYVLDMTVESEIVR